MKIIGTILSQRPWRGSPYTAPLAGLCLALVSSIAGSGLLPPGWDWGASGSQVFGQGEFWRLLTSPWVHADLRHLLSNEVFFVLFGWLLNRYYGVWVFPVLSWAAGVLIQALTLSQYPRDVSLIGASGIVYFMAAFWITLFIFIERGVPWARRLLLSAGVALALLFPETFEPQVSYLAHAWGAVLGVFLGALYFRFRRAELRAFEVWAIPKRIPVIEEVTLGAVDPADLTQRLG